MIDWSKLTFAKPGPKARATTATRRHRHERAARRKAQADVIAAVRAQVWKLDRECAVCGRPYRSDEGEMHEIVPRSQTRGKPPDERFTPWICIRLHGHCHVRTTLHDVVFEGPFDGGGVVRLRVRHRDSHEWWEQRTYQRKAFHVWGEQTMSNSTTKPTQATVKKPMRPGTKKPVQPTTR